MDEFEKRFVYIEKKGKDTNANYNETNIIPPNILPTTYTNIPMWNTIPDYTFIYNISYNTNIEIIKLKIFNIDIELPLKSIIESETGISIKNGDLEITAMYEPITKKIYLTIKKQ